MRRLLVQVSQARDVGTDHVVGQRPVVDALQEDGESHGRDRTCRAGDLAQVPWI
ncbi:MAG: hypothetical protein IPG94_21545 [Kineosporiaceae bacterium]|nr:hypothetical protein [Kineosporiaceae bacterium]